MHYRRLFILTLFWVGLASTAVYASPLNDQLKAAGLTPATQIAAAPDIQLPDEHGKPVQLGDLRGNVVFINFWATWCPPCVHEMPMMDQLLKTRKDQAFRLLAVNMQESQNDVAQFMKKKDFQFPALVDSEGVATASYQVRGLPASYLIDCSGQLLGSVTGILLWTSPPTAALLDTLLKDKSCQSS